MAQRSAGGKKNFPNPHSENPFIIEKCRSALEWLWLSFCSGRFLRPILSIITDKHPLIILFSKRSFFHRLEFLILDVPLVASWSFFRFAFVNNVSISIPIVSSQFSAIMFSSWKIKASPHFRYWQFSRLEFIFSVKKYGKMCQWSVSKYLDTRFE